MTSTLYIKGKPVTYSYVRPGVFDFNVNGKTVRSFPSPNPKSGLIVPSGLFFGVTIRETETHDLEVIK